MSSSVHIYDKRKDIIRLDQMIRLDDKTLTAEAEYPINFTQ